MIDVQLEPGLAARCGLGVVDLDLELVLRVRDICERGE